MLTSELRETSAGGISSSSTRFWPKTIPYFYPILFKDTEWKITILLLESFKSNRRRVAGDAAFSPLLSLGTCGRTTFKRSGRRQIGRVVCSTSLSKKQDNILDSNGHFIYPTFRLEERADFVKNISTIKFSSSEKAACWPAPVLPLAACFLPTACFHALQSFLQWAWSLKGILRVLKKDHILEYLVQQQQRGLPKVVWNKKWKRRGVEESTKPW